MNFIQTKAEQANDGDDDGDDDVAAPAAVLSSGPLLQYCSGCVTGTQPTFQAIWVCHGNCSGTNTAAATTTTSTSSTELQEETPTAPLCICQACAQICHNEEQLLQQQDDEESVEHDVEYIGMGPSYCDCHSMTGGGCRIHEASQREAKRLGIVVDDPVNAAEAVPETDTTSGTWHREVFEITRLLRRQPNDLSNVLLAHARALIRYSKETFWIDEHLVAQHPSPSFLNPLEQLAWAIYQRHVQHYFPELLARNGSTTVAGAEWWVQVKELHPDPHSVNGKTNTRAIDLHYDKDEALAESFGIGAFPVLSTVTYLTDHDCTTATTAAAPTLVFPHSYAQGDDEIMPQLLTSRPRRGKHLVFDGTLLHGAPFHPLLLQPAGQPVESDLPSTTEQHEASLQRVTFLVNIWQNHRPANVKPLDDHIREALRQAIPPTGNQELVMENPLVMVPQPIVEMHIEKEQDLPEALQQRIELPFVAKGITWDDDDDDESESGGLVVVTFPPPHTDEDTTLVTFGPGLQAYLEYTQEPSQEERNKEPAIHETGYV